MFNQHHTLNFSMGIENLVVRFDNPAGVFYAGQCISGVVEFTSTEPYESDGVFIKYSGQADVHWVVGRGRLFIR